MRTLALLLLTGCLNVVPEVGPDSGSAGGGMSGSGGGTGGGTSSGTGGGGGGGLVVPDAGTCGCMSNGRCVPGDSPLACGNTGGVCSRCANGEQCVNGGCVVAACGPGTCTGCCGQGFCVTPSMQSNVACGTSGGMCARCMNGQQCRNGQCVTPVCDVMSCAMGCCQGGQCLAGNMRRACGHTGAACVDCGMNGQCSGGMCMMGGLVDAGPPAPIGSACSNGSCGGGEFCLPDNAGFPAGYCTAQCGANGSCGVGTTCVTVSLFGFAQSACFATCGNGCRTGYVCQPGAADGGTAYCRPSCTNGAAATCPPGSTCSFDAGTCS